MGEQEHKIALKQQHKAFRVTYQNMKKAKRKQAEYANRNATEVTLDVGQAVFLKNNARKSKLDHRYTPYYRIVEKKTPLTFVLRHVLDGTTVHAHTRNIKAASIDEWEAPKVNIDKRTRKSTYAVTPSNSESSSDSVNSMSDSM